MNSTHKQREYVFGFVRLRPHLRYRNTHRFAAQGTVEYAVVFAAFLSIVIALGALSHLLSDGALIDHAYMEASHHLGGSGGVWRDVFLH